jgi:6,7-dimethyl-8-ribityllumazine synthase
MPRTIEEDTDGHGLGIAIAVSRFRSEITERLLAGALEALAERGVQQSRVLVAWVPGAFELPFAARRLAGSGRFDAVVCLGCVIKGETSHNEYISHHVARGIGDVSLQTGVPVVFAVITPNTLEQARARAGDGERNKGYEGAVTAIVMANLNRRLRSL